MHRRQFRQGFIAYIDVFLADVPFLQFIYLFNTSHVMQMKKRWCLPVALCPNSSYVEGPHVVHAYLEDKVIRFPRFTVLVFKVVLRACSNVTIYENYLQWIGIQFCFFFRMRNLTFVQYHYLPLHYPQSVALVSAHFSSLYLHLYSFDSVDLCYYFFSAHLVDFVLCQICLRQCFWNPVPCSFIGDKDFLLVIWDILFYVPLFYVFLALLYEYFFSSLSFPLCLQKCGPSSSQACGICLEDSIFSVLDHEVAYVSKCGH